MVVIFVAVGETAFAFVVFVVVIGVVVVLDVDVVDDVLVS